MSGSPSATGASPASPPPRDHPSKAAPHEARDLAESFGTDPEGYDRVRPRYPGAMVEQIVSRSPGPEVLDVGIGTGIAARQFREAGCRVLGVDVDDRMADAARRQGFDVEGAAFEDWDPAGRVFDAVISGQAWHWVNPVTGAARAAQSLRSGGRLAVFWNVFQPPADLADAFSDVYRRVLPDTPFSRGTASGVEGYGTILTRTADGIEAVNSFRDPEQWRFEWDRSYTRDEWLELLPTSGGHRQFPPGKLDELLAGIGAAIDAVGGCFLMRYIAVVVTAVRRDSAEPTSAPGQAL
ncbi:MAG TPA: class I SAM-dependent methyltransferase [Acidimicrobiales bacterium]|nr:class I SAM-dependent methyltransferase [Acidimicrobiales bacterium]